jgi:curved DNA-binding protein CbpA
MIALHNAYQVLGLEPGTSFESIKRRYKQLVMVWHPDRMQNDSGKRGAEEELKKINHAFDALRDHFEKHHRQDPSCDCQANQGLATGHDKQSSQRGHSGNDENDQSRRDEDRRRKEEEEAWRQEEERRRRAEAAAAEEASRKAEHKRQAAEAAKQSVQDAVKQDYLLNEEKFRQRVALAAGAALVLVLLFAYVGVAARNAFNDIQRQWTTQPPCPDTAQNPQLSPPVTSTSPPATDDPDNPYIPMEYRFPGGNPASWRKFMQDEEIKQKQREEEQRKQDIYFTKLAIDRNQRIIDHCITTIGQLEAKIADPCVSEFEKNKLRDYLEFQQRNLTAAEHELADVQEKLNHLLSEIPGGSS